MLIVHEFRDARDARPPLPARRRHRFHEHHGKPSAKSCSIPNTSVAWSRSSPAAVIVSENLTRSDDKRRPSPRSCSGLVRPHQYPRAPSNLAAASSRSASLRGRQAATKSSSSSSSMFLHSTRLNPRHNVRSAIFRNHRATNPSLAAAKKEKKKKND